MIVVLQMQISFMELSQYTYDCAGGKEEWKYGRSAEAEGEVDTSAHVGREKNLRAVSHV